MDVYKSSSLLTRLHVLIRINTCPFLAVEKFIPKDGRIIDYGCGYGIFSHILAITSPERKTYGVDISEKKIKEGKKSLSTEKGVIFSTDCDIIDLVKGASGMVMIDLLCYFSHKERVQTLKMFYDNMTIDTVLVIKDQNRSFSLKYLFLCLQEFLAVKVFKITEATMLSFFTKRYLLTLLDDIGFTAQSMDLSKHYFYPHVLFVCKKKKHTI